MSSGGVPNIRWSEARVSCACPSATRQNFSEEPMDVVDVRQAVADTLSAPHLHGNGYNHQRRARIADLNLLAHTALSFQALPSAALYITFITGAYTHLKSVCHGQ